MVSQGVKEVKKLEKLSQYFWLDGNTFTLTNGLTP